MFHSEDRIARADGARRRGPGADELGRRAAKGRGRPQGCRAEDRDPDRRPGLERRGLPAAADRAAGARLAARRLARRRHTRRDTARALSGAPSFRRGDGRYRRGRVDPGRRHRPPALDADPRPAPAQGDAQPRTPGRRRRPSGRPRSTAAPRRRCATRPGAPRRSLDDLAAELGRALPAAAPAERTPTAGARRGALRPGNDRRRLRRAHWPWPGRRTRPRRLLRLRRRRSASPTTAPGLSRFPSRRTPVACARSAACPTAGPGFAETPRA